VAFLNQQLAHLAIVIEGQMRAPTGLDGAHPGIHPLGHFYWLTGWGYGRFQSLAKPSRQHK
jgi:hypothetical protein